MAWGLGSCRTNVGHHGSNAKNRFSVETGRRNRIVGECFATNAMSQNRHARVIQ
jgi:hypothetical protein